ncbi:MAG TPA: DUF3326 domain-containing protein [Coleofasciculaceae cyanobacterium]
MAPAIVDRTRPLTAALLIPTGIGAAIGGYAGDGLPVARAVAAAVDCLITHPNVLNGAMLYWPLPNALYVEGYALDRLAAGDWALRPVRQNRIAVILDRAIEPELRLRQLQAADAARATLGIHVTDALVTDRPLGVSLRLSPSGASWGTIAQPDSLLRAADRAIAAGAEAIAVVARFPDEESDLATAYRQGRGVDPIAGAEAVISHLVVREFGIPCAHAPALASGPPSPDLAPRSAAEELGYTFLPCVLAGLWRSPQILRAPAQWQPNDLTGSAVDVVIVPTGACGGAAVLHWAAAGADILAVDDNTTAIDLPPTALGLRVTHVRSYLEAIGWLTARRAGLWPAPRSPDRHALPPLALQDPCESP